MDNLLKSLVVKRLEQLRIEPNQNLGQHFLVDEQSLNLLTQSVSPNTTVIEIGAGVGQITQLLAKKAKKVFAIEIDRRYKPILSGIAGQHPNIEIIIADALKVNFEDIIGKDFKDVQIIANLPYHITEPVLHKIAKLPIKCSSLVVGKRLADAVQADESNPDFGQLSLLARTFFNVELIATLEKSKILPPPRTESAIIRLIPKKETELKSNARDYLLRKLFLTSKQGTFVKNVLKEGLIEFHSGKLLTQNQAREIIKNMGIPSTVLEKPFQQLNNSELAILSSALRLYS
ncbi:hypothetical protein HYT02_05250 [Candidatus Gottesmanbacteria bacterium]|nr:hypothetical protein [Candidatus Gottesmanbacteria bacterium]